LHDQRALAASQIGVPIADFQATKFPDGETAVRSYERLRGRDVFILQPTSRPVNESLLSLLLMITTARRNGANKVTAVIPFYGYGRAVGALPAALDSQTAQLVQDAKLAQSRPGASLKPVLESHEQGYGGQSALETCPISAADVARLLESAGVDSVIAVELQLPGRGQIEGFFSPCTPVENIRAISAAMPEITRKWLTRPVVVAPHEDCLDLAREVQAGVERLQKQRAGIAVILDSGSTDDTVATAQKMAESPSGEQSDSSMALVGDVHGCDVIIVDSLVDTARSLCARARFLKRHGARRVIAYATHGLFSGEALRRIDRSAIDELIVTDTISADARDHEHKFELSRSRKIRRVSVAPLLADAIERVHAGDSLQHLRVFDHTATFGAWTDQ
jgi:ribose-phosphate pyrophosphokinase